jgi:hypothetical protein
MIFLGRWTSVLRAVVPALAGMGRMPYPRFFVFNVIGGIAWTVAFGMAGYAAGESYHYIESATGWGSWIVTGLVIAGFTLGWVVRRRRRSRLLAGAPVVLRGDRGTPDEAGAPPFHGPSADAGVAPHAAGTPGATHLAVMR